MTLRKCALGRINDLNLQLRESLELFEEDMIGDTVTKSTPDDGNLRVGDVLYSINKEIDAVEQVPTGRHALTTKIFKLYSDKINVRK